MRLKFMTLLLAGTALSSSAFAQVPGATQPTLADCDKAITVLEQNRSADTGVTLDQVKALRAQKNAQGCQDVLARVDPTSAGSKTTATIKVEQASPQVTVAQPQPNVTVNQGKPEIFVHQPAPTVTVDIPQPEITVKMPNPDVNVSMAQPKVDVTQASPQVQLVQPSQPQVQVQRGEPQVNVQQSANAQPKVTVEGTAQGQVHYDRDDPKVVINQAKGQPQVKFEQTGATADTKDKTAAANPTTPDTATNPAPRDTSADTASPKGPPTQQMSVSRLNGLNLYNANGDNLGDIERVVMGKDGQPHIIIGNGGFFGIGEKRVAIPLQKTAMRGNRLVIQGLSDDQIRAMPTWTSSTGDQELAKDKTVPVTTIQ